MCEICHKFVCPAGCPNASEPKIRGYCEQCGDELREDYEYYTDNDENKFCSSECACKYHGIKTKEWSEFY